MGEQVEGRDSAAPQGGMLTSASPVAATSTQGEIGLKFALSELSTCLGAQLNLESVFSHSSSHFLFK